MGQGVEEWPRVRFIFPVQPHDFDLSCSLYSVVWGSSQLYHLGLFYMLENVPTCVYRTKAQLASSLSQGKSFSENGFSAGWGRQVYTFLRYSVQPPSPRDVCLLHISWLASESVPTPFGVHVPLHLQYWPIHSTQFTPRAIWPGYSVRTSPPLEPGTLR